jgi:hypothetical protein
MQQRKREHRVHRSIHMQAGFFHLRQEEKVSCGQVAVVSEFKDHAEADDKANTKRHDPGFEIVDTVVSGTHPMPRGQQHKYLKLYTVHEPPQHRGIDVQTMG